MAVDTAEVVELACMGTVVEVQSRSLLHTVFGSHNGTLLCGNWCNMPVGIEDLGSFVVGCCSHIVQHHEHIGEDWFCSIV